MAPVTTNQIPTKNPGGESLRHLWSRGFIFPFGVVRKGPHFTRLGSVASTWFFSAKKLPRSRNITGVECSNEKLECTRFQYHLLERTCLQHIKSHWSIQLSKALSTISAWKFMATVGIGLSISYTSHFQTTTSTQRTIWRFSVHPLCRSHTQPVRIDTALISPEIDTWLTIADILRLESMSMWVKQRHFYHPWLPGNGVYPHRHKNGWHLGMVAGGLWHDFTYINYVDWWKTIPVVCELENHHVFHG